jgi:hypothetical protein
MKDSIWTIPFYDDIIEEEEERAYKKQKCYESELNDNGSLLNKAKDMAPHDAFNFLKDCKCCFQHQINKPTKFMKLNNTKSPISKQVKKCNCDCRQLSRMLCRGWDLNNLTTN